MSVIKVSDIQISLEMTKNLIDVERYAVQWKQRADEIPRELLSRLRNASAFESIGSSNRIEGNTLTDEEVQKVLSGLNMKTFRTRDEQEVAGYAEALDIIFSDYESIPLTENHIKQLHQILMKYSDKDERHRGEYKKLDNSVAAFDENGNEIGIVFRTASAFETPMLMEQLVKETNDLFCSNLLSPLITIGLFIVHYLAIHPFQDGNGRTARLLTILLLMRAGYSYMPYYSMEKLIEDTKDSYYRCLRMTQLTFQNEKIDYRPWLEYFIALLARQTKCLDEKVLEYRSSTLLPGNEQKVIDIIKELNGAGYGDISKQIPDMKPNTLRRILRHLQSLHIIEKHGEGKGSWYCFRRS